MDIEKMERAAYDLARSRNPGIGRRDALKMVEGTIHSAVQDQKEENKQNLESGETYKKLREGRL